MIQDIFPSRLNNSFADCKPDADAVLLHFDADGRLLARIDNGELHFLFLSAAEASACGFVYLFSVDTAKYFLLFSEPANVSEGYARYSVRELRDQCGGAALFAAFTAYHLWKWYDDNRYCGRCRGKLLAHGQERALRCPDCGSVIYPRINPAVIVGVVRGDQLLITRYRRGYAHNALVAGFTEIGETLEETVAREVMEETGVRVKNIRYYKSQPWGMAQDLLAGFFCEAEGSGEIHMDTNELKYAEWVQRDQIELQPNNLSLTNEMMRVFKEGRGI